MDATGVWYGSKWIGMERLINRAISNGLNASVSVGALPTHSTMQSVAEIAGSNAHVRIIY